MKINLNILKLVCLSLCLGASVAQAENKDFRLKCTYKAIVGPGAVVDRQDFEAVCDSDQFFAKQIANNKVLAATYIPEGCDAIIGFFKGNTVEYPINYEVIEVKTGQKKYPKAPVTVQWMESSGRKLHEITCKGI